jgi:hypothetical protein
VREKLGLDATKYRGTVAAPMREDIHHLFAALGLLVAEIWGMSETALTVSNQSQRIKMGTVGRPQPVSVRARSESGPDRPRPAANSPTASSSSTISTVMYERRSPTAATHSDQRRDLLDAVLHPPARCSSPAR